MRIIYSSNIRTCRLLPGLLTMTMMMKLISIIIILKVNFQILKNDGNSLYVERLIISQTDGRTDGRLEGWMDFAE